MGEGPRKGGATVAARSPERIRQEIEELREELGETVEALTAKADVRAHAREKVEDLKAGVRERTGERVDPDRVIAVARSSPLPWLVAGALVVGFLVGRATRRWAED